MKRNYILLVLLSSLIISCGKSEKEIQQEKAQIALEQKIAAEKLEKQKEKERIHLEKIEVGKELTKNLLQKEWERYKELLEKEKDAYAKINEFQWGRTATTKAQQLQVQRKKIDEVSSYVSRIENELAQTNLRQNFEFQNSPEELLNYIFRSAENKDSSKFRFLCDPYTASGQFCLVELLPVEMRRKILNSIKNGRIMGEIKIIDDTATVEVAVGENSDRLKQVQMVMRMDKWYIKEF